MCENIKDFWELVAKRKKLIMLIVGLALILLPVALVLNHGMDIFSKIKAYRYIGTEAMYRNMITFTGEGKIYTKPDIATVTLSVVTESKTVADVQKKNTEKMNKAIDFLKGFGVEDKDIKTTNYNLYPRYNYEYVRVPQIVGYEITQSLEVKIRNLDKVGEILEGSVNAGVNQVYSLYFKVDKDEEFKSQAKELAIKDAKKKAEETAKQLGVKLGKLSGYSEGGGYYPPIYSAYDKAMGVGGGGESVPNIQTGENEITVTVTLTYEIE